MCKNLFLVAVLILSAIAISGCTEIQYDRVTPSTLVDSPKTLDGKYVVANALVEHASHSDWVTYTPIFCPNGGKNGGVHMCGMVPWFHHSDTYRIHASMDASSHSLSHTWQDGKTFDGSFRADVFAHVHSEWRWQFFAWHSKDRVLYVDFLRIVPT
jgi:hypothetical protein